MSSNAAGAFLNVREKQSDVYELLSDILWDAKRPRGQRLIFSIACCTVGLNLRLLENCVQMHSRRSWFTADFIYFSKQIGHARGGVDAFLVAPHQDTEAERMWFMKGI
jgi:hypothetical protein